MTPLPATPTYGQAFLSRPSTRAQRRVALGMAGLFLGLVALIWPLAGEPGPVLPSFFGMFFVAVILCNAFISLLLGMQAAHLRHPALALLAGAYTFLAAVATTQMLVGPDIIKPGSLLPAHPQTVAWLSFLTRTGFPLLVWLALRQMDGMTPQWKLWLAWLLPAVAGPLTAFYLARRDYLPALAVDHRWTHLLTEGLLPFSAIVILGVTLELVRRTRLRTRLHLWVLVGLIGLFCDAVLTYAAGGTYTVGFYGARVMNLLSCVVLLGALFWDIHDIHGTLQKLNAQLHQDAIRDALTGLYQRRYFEDCLTQSLVRPATSPAPVLILFDVDRFKAYNDSFGHLSGDHCLASIAEAVLATLPHQETVVARYGGEEFVVLLTGTAAQRAEHWAEALRRCVEVLRMPHALQAQQPWVTVSVGWAAHQAGQSRNQWLATADRALYAAKGQGRNRAVSAQALANA